MEKRKGIIANDLAHLGIVGDNGKVKITVPYHELEFSFVRSSGPGGQNVNKVNSKAVLRWNILGSPSLPILMRTRILTKLASRITADGDLILTSDRFRDQKMNKDDCIEKLAELLEGATHLPKPRKATKPTRSAKRRTLDKKGRDAQKKKLRGRVRSKADD